MKRILSFLLLLLLILLLVWLFFFGGCKYLCVKHDLCFCDNKNPNSHVDITIKNPQPTTPSSSNTDFQLCDQVQVANSKDRSLDQATASLAADAVDLVLTHNGDAGSFTLSGMNPLTSESEEFPAQHLVFWEFGDGHYETTIASGAGTFASTIHAFADDRFNSQTARASSVSVYSDEEEPPEDTRPVGTEGTSGIPTASLPALLPAGKQVFLDIDRIDEVPFVMPNDRIKLVLVFSAESSTSSQAYIELDPNLIRKPSGEEIDSRSWFTVYHASTNRRGGLRPIVVTPDTAGGNIYGIRVDNPEEATEDVVVVFELGTQDFEIPLEPELFLKITAHKIVVFPQQQSIDTVDTYILLNAIGSSRDPNGISACPSCQIKKAGEQTVSYKLDFLNEGSAAVRDSVMLRVLLDPQWFDVSTDNIASVLKINKLVLQNNVFDFESQLPVDVISESNGKIELVFKINLEASKKVCASQFEGGTEELNECNEPFNLPGLEMGDSFSHDNCSGYLIFSIQTKDISGCDDISADGGVKFDTNSWVDFPQSAVIRCGDTNEPAACGF